MCVIWRTRRGEGSGGIEEGKKREGRSVVDGKRVTGEKGEEVEREGGREEGKGQ